MIVDIRLMALIDRHSDAHACRQVMIKMGDKQKPKNRPYMSRLIPERVVIKHLRQRFARWLISGMVSDHKNVDALNQNRVSRVLVCRPNHRLGNLLAMTPLLTELENLLPGAEIDFVAAGGIAHEVFSGYANVARVFLLPRHAFKSPFQYAKIMWAIRKRNYDLVINTKANSSTGRLITNLAKASYRILTPRNSDALNCEERRHFAKGPVYLLREHLNYSGSQQEKIPPLDIRLTRGEIQWGRETLSRIHQQGRQKHPTRTIALYTHATGKKCYDEAWWWSFYNLISEKHSNHAFIEILPAHAQSSLNFAIPAFYSTDIRKLASLISATEVFIGADGGVMHLASAAKVQTIGLLSFTDPETFGPYGERNFSIKTNDKSLELIVEQISESLVKSLA